MLRHPGQARHLDAVAAVGRALDQLVQKDDRLVPLLDRDRVVADAVVGRGQVGQFVVVGGEQGLDAAAVFLGQVLGHRPGDGQPVVG